MTAGQTIDYDALAQDALRGVVRTVLTAVAKSGLPGDHHFYISFDTQAPGVVLSKRLREKYPEEMTIVLQHRFWDLMVNEDRFEVKLTFDGIPERLVVPFASLQVFFDPSVRYGLQFEEPAAEGDGERTGAPDAPRTRPGPRKPKAARKPRAEKAVGEGAAETTPRAKPAAAPVDQAAPAAPRPGPVPVPAPQPAGALPAPAAPAAAATETSGGAQIVSLDAFRKK